MFDRLFDLTAHGTTVRREIVAGITTFLTMSYIMFTIPSTVAGAGMNQEAVFVATCLAAAAATLLMGLFAKLPIAVAPSVGLSTYFAYTAVPSLNMHWEVALGCVFLSGILFLLISITPARELLINAIPKSLRLAIAAGVGFFLALIGLINAGVVINSPITTVQQGILADPKVLIAAGGLVVIFTLAAWRVTGAILIGIVFALAVAIGLRFLQLPITTSVPASITPTFMAMQFDGPTEGAIATAVFVFLLMDMLETSGTLMAVGGLANLLDEQGRFIKARRALAVSALGTMIGAALGTSPVAAYMGSATGIQAGGRTGLTAIVVAALFLLSLFIAPTIEEIPLYVTAPALIFVAALMVKGLKDIDWDDLTEAAPALLTALTIPLTYSIPTGIGVGFISYVVIKAVSGRWRDVNFAVFIIAAAFVAKIALTAPA